MVLVLLKVLDLLRFDCSFQRSALLYAWAFNESFECAFLAREDAIC